MRKIVQISSPNLNVVFCLCDDGTMWKFSHGFWELLPDIPQDKAKPPLKLGDMV